MTPTNKHLFLFTIGPVQSFIAQARKTQDLYAGSRILSKLIQEAVDTIGHNNILFPNTENALNSFPNRLIALVEVADLQAFGKQVEQNVREKWLTITRAPIQAFIQYRIQQNKPVKFNIDGINQQLKQHLEVFWLFEPLTDYQISFKNIERNLRVMKNARSFQQFTYEGIGEQGRKCSLDGERNAFFFGEGTNMAYLKKWNPFALELEGTQYNKVTKNEGLSAVSFAKRFYQIGQFPSTAKIALWNLCKDEKTSLIRKEYKKMFVDDSFDDELLFVDNLHQDYFDKHGIQLASSLEEVQKKRRQLVQKAREQGLTMSKYYALLSFDGDDMGKWLSGDNTPNIDLKEFHLKLSNCLGAFAEKATTIVNKFGRTVYAGGDDFLGLVQLEGIFKILKLLRISFDEIVNTTLQKKFPSLKKILTFSAGITIAHYKTPLNIVINKTKIAQEIAKEQHHNKNAIAFKLKNLDKMEAIFKSLQADFSDKWIRTFCQEFYLFPVTTKEGEKKEIASEFRPLVEIELKRLLTRACKLTGKQKKTQVAALAKTTFDLFAATDYNYNSFTELLNITNATVKRIVNPF